MKMQANAREGSRPVRQPPGCDRSRARVVIADRKIHPLIRGTSSRRAGTRALPELRVATPFGLASEAALHGVSDIVALLEEFLAERPEI
jgi:hypothetical protein